MAKKGRYIYQWPRPMVTVDVLVFGIFGESGDVDKVRRKGGTQTKLLLIRRKKEPFKNKWAIPGGFVEMDEELQDAAKRELAEETGVKTVELEQLHTFGAVGRDPLGRQITVAFMCLVQGERIKAVAGDDAAGVRWFDILSLPEDMAFDHRKVAKYAIARLPGKTIQA